MNITLQDLIAWRDALRILKDVEETGCLTTPDFLQCLRAYSALNAHIEHYAEQVNIQVTA